MLEGMQMRKDKLIFALLTAFILSGCEGYQLGGPFAEKPAGYTGGSMCKQERPMQVEYAPQQFMSVPTCHMNELTVPLNELEIAKAEGLYEPVAYVNEDEVRAVEPIVEIEPKTDELDINPDEIEPKTDEWDINPDEIEGEFPDVENNKYNKKQVILQNLESRVLAFCRGSKKAIDVCVERLSCAGFTRITNVPRLPAKYDLAPNKGYPARRWREGESVPRW